MAKKTRRGRKTHQKTFVRQWREKRNKTQEQMAEALGVSVSLISRIENGARQYTQEFIELAADYLETDPASLIMRDPSSPNALWTIYDQLTPARRTDLERIAAVYAEEEAAKKKTG